MTLAARVVPVVREEHDEGGWAAPECAISGQRFLGFRLDFMCFDLFFKNKKKQRWILIFHYILSEKTDLKW